jgi:DNA-binding transcriptional LysR family regulator
MSYESRALRSFVALSETLSFTKAAELLGVTQPHLSARIKGLEKQLGFALFCRTSRRVEITVGGQQFLEAARRFLAEAESLKRIADNIRNGRSTSVRVGTANCHPHVRWSLLGRFIEEYPQIDLKMKLFQSPAELSMALRTGEVDVAFGVAPVPEEFDYVILSCEKAGLLLRPDTALAKLESIKPESLAGQQIGIFARKLAPELHDQITSRVGAHGAWFSEIPEPGIECMSHFVRATGNPVIAARWWQSKLDKPIGLAHSCIEGIDISITSVLRRSRSRSTQAASLLWKVAEKLFEQQREVGRLPRPAWDKRLFERRQPFYL